MKNLKSAPIDRVGGLYRAHIEKGVPVLLDVSAVAALTGLSVQKLNIYRMKNGTAGPPFKRFGRNCRYPLAELIKWIEQQPLQSA